MLLLLRHTQHFQINLLYLSLRQFALKWTVAENEADIKLRKISVDSPIGKGLLGKVVGQIAEIETPGGLLKFEIINISR